MTLVRMPEHPTAVPPPQPSPSSEVSVIVPSPKSQVSKKGIPSLNPDNLDDLRFTRVEGFIGEKYARKWKELVDIGIRLALQSDHDVRALNAYLSTNIRDGIHTGEGYSPIEDLNVSVQGMSANNAAKTLVLLAKKLNCGLKLVVSWHGKSPHAGKQGIIRWPF